MRSSLFSTESFQQVTTIIPAEAYVAGEMAKRKRGGTKVYLILLWHNSSWIVLAFTVGGNNG